MAEAKLGVRSVRLVVALDIDHEPSGGLVLRLGLVRMELDVTLDGER